MHSSFQEAPKRNDMLRFLNSHGDEKGNDPHNHPFSIEFYIGLIFVFVLGFMGVQKVSHIALESLKDPLCQNGFSLPYLNCEEGEALSLREEATLDNRQAATKAKKMIVGMSQTQDAPTLRTQLSRAKDLNSALKILKWNEGDEQDAVRFLSIITAIENGRMSSSGMPSTMTSVLDDIWNKYPDILASSHCLNCSHFYKNILQPYFNEGTRNKDRITQIARGHPRFLQAIYQSGQISAIDLKSIAKLHAELLTSEDAKTAKFIGKILHEQDDLELLHHWSSKGWNGSYAISDYSQLLQLPKNIIVDAWERGVVKGADNAEITRYLVSTGYRPALRWLLWVHAGDLRYFQDTPYQAEKDRYNKLILSLHTDFSLESKYDLTGFYSKHWKSIIWDQSTKKWIYQKS